MGYIPADLLHDTGKFVAKRHGLTHADRAETAMMIVMQIRPANSTDSDSDQNLICTEERHANIFNAQIFRCVDYDSSHGLLLP